MEGGTQAAGLKRRLLDLGRRQFHPIPRTGGSGSRQNGGFFDAQIIQERSAAASKNLSHGEGKDGLGGRERML